MSEKRIAQLIGNGPTKSAFKRIEGADVYVCNLGAPEVIPMAEVSATFIHDRRPFLHLMKTEDKILKDTNIIFRHQYGRLAQNCAQKGILSKTKLTQLPRMIRERTSGHDGIVFLLFKHPKPYDEVHLYGFDSLVNGKVTSDSKSKIKGSNPQQNRIPLWLSRFKVIFKHAKEKNKSIILHTTDTETKKLA